MGQRDRGHRVARPSSSSSTTRPTSTPRSPRPPARRPGCRPSRPPRATCSRPPGSRPRRRVSLGEDPYAAAADSWAAGQPPSLTEDDDESAARRLYDLALEYQERSQRSEAAPARAVRGRCRPGLIAVIGDLIIVDDDDERLIADRPAAFRAEVLPEDADDEWRTLSGADELVEFYDPTDVFGDLADALAEAFPAVAPELADADERRPAAATRSPPTEPAAADGEAEAADDEADDADARGRADRVTMRLAAAELVDSREILPGQWLQAYHAPALATGSRAGQFVHVRTGRLLRDWSCAARSRSTRPTRRPASITIHFRVIGRGTDWFTRLRPGDAIDLLGPLGRPFEVDPRSRHLLLVAGGLGMAGVRMLADEAIRDGRQVTLLFGAASAREVYPSSLLPDEVEYVVATDDGSPRPPRLRDRARRRLRGAGPTRRSPAARPPMLAALARLAAGRRGPARRRQARPQAGRRQGRPGRLAGRAPEGVPPGLDGAEHGLRGRGVPRLRGDEHVGRPQRVCREGPVFAAEEIAWEGGW